MSADYTEDVKERLLHELTDARQGVNDSEMPMPGNPNLTGEVGPSPGPNSIPESFAALDGEKGPDETGEEEDPGDAYAGGVNANNTDGAVRLPGERESNNAG
ncbi:MAG: hypothetical protein ACRYFS_02300 [Janthinobacterium lividum]